MEALRLRGYAVVGVRDGDSLYELVRSAGRSNRCFRAVVADLRMPGSSIRRSLDWIQKHWKGTPFVVVTGTALVEQEPWLKEEAVPVLPKPINLDRLTALIASGDDQ